MEELNFKTVVVCRNPMEAEIYPASLREDEIPHRTEWNRDGTLTIMVPEDWLEDARSTLERASKVFFQKDFQSSDSPGETGSEGSEAEKKDTGAENSAKKPRRESEAVEETLNHQEEPPKDESLPEQDLDFGRWSLFSRDGLHSPDELKIRPVWPAWALGCLPGTGLGHLYAGKFQMFLYLVFISILGILFFQYTGSYFSFLLNLFSWSIDVGFAALHVKEHNRRALRFRKMDQEAEQRFLDSL